MKHGKAITGFDWHPVKNQAIFADCLGDIHYASTFIPEKMGERELKGPCEKVGADELKIGRERGRNIALESQLFDVEAFDDEDLDIGDDELMDEPEEMSPIKSVGISYQANMAFRIKEERTHLPEETTRLVRL